MQDILNNGENVISLNNYKNSVQKLLNLEDTLPLIPDDAWMKLIQFYFYLEGTSFDKYCIAKRALMWEVYNMHSLDIV